ncbi:MAG: hypothetical protein HQL57_09260 [Magnetococcales bacterium]|nr:hypothetical protein [Magnetococcales bacterium]MBF0157356.1 hypothetical protein [Magnetococcales bacterium]
MLIFIISTLVFVVAAIGVGRWVIVPRIKRQRILASYDVCPPWLLPELPKELDKVVKVGSRTRDNKSYAVNFYRLSCNCRRFRHSRSHYPPNDIHRLCRHLRQELDTSNVILRYDELTRRIIKDRVRDKFYRKMTLLGTEMAFGFHPESDFIRVFTRRRQANDPAEGPFTGIYDKFTFNADQDIWIHGESPPGAEAIVKTIYESVVRSTPNNERVKV